MTDLRSSPIRAAVAGALIIAALDSFAPQASAQELAQHVDLSIQLLELSVAEWEERLAVPATDSAETRAAALAAIEKKYKTERERAYERSVTTASAHLAFFATNAAKVEEYLEEFPEVKTRIDSLSQTVRDLIARAESPGGPPGGPQ
jgi:hypothetical protein